MTVEAPEAGSHRGNRQVGYLSAGIDFEKSARGAGLTSPFGQEDGAAGDVPVRLHGHHSSEDLPEPLVEARQREKA